MDGGVLLVRCYQARFDGAVADESALLEARGFLDQNLPVLEVQLSKHAYICGDGVTIADTIGAAYVQAMKHFPGQQIFSAMSPA